MTDVVRFAAKAVVVIVAASAAAAAVVDSAMGIAVTVVAAATVDAVCSVVVMVVSSATKWFVRKSLFVSMPFAPLLLAAPEGDLFDDCACSERVFTDFCDATADGDRFEIFAAFEGVLANGYHALGHF